MEGHGKLTLGLRSFRDSYPLMSMQFAEILTFEQLQEAIAASVGAVHDQGDWLCHSDEICVNRLRAR